MKSRDKILMAIRAANLEPVQEPEVPVFSNRDKNLIEGFQKMVEAGNGKVYKRSALNSVEKIVNQLFPKAKEVASAVAEIPGNFDLQSVKSPVELKNIDVAIIRGQLGVAENGAIWVSEADSIHRVLPFITQHLILLLDEKHIIGNMHEAYRQIKVDAAGFGVFIAGPSKTADIEQSLVIGAHGARSLTVILI